jgi:two-component system, LuxR family, sensor kinase FixL
VSKRGTLPKGADAATRPDGSSLVGGFADHASTLGLWLWEWRLATNQLDFTAGWERLLGHEPGELPTGIDLFKQLCHPDDQAAVAAALQDCLAGRTPEYLAEHRLRSKAGDWRWFADRGRVVERSPDGRAVRMLGMRSDVSDRKRAEAAQQQSIEHHRLFAQSNSAGFWTRDPNGTLAFVDPAVAASFGLPQRLIGVEARHAPVHPDDRAAIAQAWSTAEATGEPFECEHRMRMADGEYRWVLARAFPVRDAEGRIVNWLGSSNIVHDRRVAELALRDREDHLRSILDTVPEAIIVMDEAGVVRSFSAGAERMFGYAADEMIGNKLGRLMSRSLEQAHEKGLEAYLRTGEARIVGRQRTVQARRKSGATFPAEVFVGEARLNGKRVFSGFVRDLTERRAIEQRLRRLQDELSFVGRTSAMVAMGSAIAHELNQPLAASSNYLAALKTARARELTGFDVDGTIDAAIAQIARAGDVLRHLRSFVSRDRLRLVPENLVAIIEDAVALALVGQRGISTVAEVGAGAEWIMAERVQVQQVLFNLVRNAAEALAEVETPAIGIVASRTGDVVLIEVRDNGPGLPERRRKRLFEPLRSSKPGGMGVGLAICNEIVQAHGGRIWAEAGTDGGTVFNVILPAAEPPR